MSYQFKEYKYGLLDNGLTTKDINSGIKVLKSFQITMATQTRKFELEFSKKLGAKHALMVNSGSSANLLAIFASGNPLRKNRLKPGDEVLVPVLCWPTSVWPLIQFGLKPVFVDIDVLTLNISESELIKKITKKTKAIFIINVLGISCDLYKIKEIAKKNNLIIFEDNCESLGSKIKNKYLGTFGDFSTFSFFYSHQITSGEGGMVVCNNDNDYEILFSLRSHGWLGGVRFYPRNWNKFNYYAKKYPNLDPRYIFINSGFNFRPTDIQAAIGLSQFKKLDTFIKNRNINKELIVHEVENSSKWNYQFRFIKVPNNFKPSWMLLPIILDKKYKYKKKNL
jgi:CDP-6-deoxy-D-xylo-4-hexulose-3-dehydrase